MADNLFRLYDNYLLYYALRIAITENKQNKIESGFIVKWDYFLYPIILIIIKSE